MTGVGLAQRDQATLQALTQEVVTSSAIEGETLDKAAVRSSIARRLGVDIGALAPADRHVDGVVDMVLDATQHHAEPLTPERLFGWHAALFPTGYSGRVRIHVGAWRDDAARPTQVVSGPMGREKVHYEAPPANRLAQETTAFWTGSTRRAPATHSSTLGWSTCGWSRCTLLTTATAASAARCATWRWRAPKAAASAFTA